MPRWRLGARLRQQDWVALAIDLAIVVGGVFLGIQASNWNDARREHAASRSYLARIADDLQTDVRNLDQHEQYWRDEAGAGERGLRFAQTGAGTNDWAVLNDFYAAGQTWRYSTNDPTYSELLSAGKLDLIRDIALRKQLSEYYISRRDQIAFLGGGTQPDYRRDIRSLVPFDLQHYLIVKCQGGERILFLPQQCPRADTSANLAKLDHQIASDQKLMGELRFWMIDIYYTRRIAGQRHRNAAALSRKIEKSLG